MRVSQGGRTPIENALIGILPRDQAFAGEKHPLRSQRASRSALILDQDRLRRTRQNRSTPLNGVKINNRVSRRVEARNALSFRSGRAYGVYTRSADRFRVLGHGARDHLGRDPSLQGRRCGVAGSPVRRKQRAIGVVAHSVNAPSRIHFRRIVLFALRNYQLKIALSMSFSGLERKRSTSKNRIIYLIQPSASDTRSKQDRRSSSSPAIACRR